MCYIGQSVNILTRWQSHVTGTRSLIGKAIKEHTVQNFVFEILEECSKEELNDREIFWISHFNSLHPNGYNKTSGGSSIMIVSDETRKKISEANKGRPLSEATKKKISEANKKSSGPKTDEHKKKISEAKKGSKHSEETKRKMSEAHKTRPPTSEETKRKMSETRRGMKYSKKIHRP